MVDIINLSIIKLKVIFIIKNYDYEINDEIIRLVDKIVLYVLDEVKIVVFDKEVEMVEIEDYNLLLMDFGIELYHIANQKVGNLDFIII